MLAVAIEMIANKLFDTYIEKMEAKVFIQYLNVCLFLIPSVYPDLQPADSCRAKELESCAQLLLFKFNHLRGRIKQVADKYLTKLVDK